MATSTGEVCSVVGEIAEKYPANRGSLIPILQDIQDALGYLSEEAIMEIERVLGISANEIYGVATFYTQFRFQPPAAHRIHVCQGTACHVRGSKEILQEFEMRLGVEVGQSTPDGKFELGRVACVGCCALSPVVTVDGLEFAEVTRTKVGAILNRYGYKKEADE